MAEPKIKVLHLIKTLSLGGAETNLLNLARSFDDTRFEMHLGYSYGGHIEERFTAAGLRLFKYAEKDHKIKSAATFAIVARLAGYMRRERINIVHTHNFNAHVWGVLAAKITGVKVVEHVHDFRYMEADDYKRRHGNVDQLRFIKYFKGLSDRVIVLTRQNRDFLSAHGYYPADRVREIQNGIPLDPSARTGTPPAAELGLPSGSKIILTTARMAEEKNIGLILAVAGPVLKRHPDACFVIAGDGPLLPELRKRADSLGLSARVRFIGYRSQIEDLLGLSSIFLLPSFLELHSISILEAMKMGVPVVVSAGVGCNDEFIRHGENGLLLDPFSEAGWAEGICRLLADEPYRQRVGSEGNRTCRELFNIRETAKKIEAVYEELAVR